MKLLTKGWAILAALLVGGLIAVSRPALASKLADAPQAGTLYVYDDGKLFTDSGIDKAKATMGNAKFDHGLTMTISTYKEIPADKKGGYKEESKAKFFKDWAVSLASNDKAKGIYVLVCRSPGYVEVIADKTTRERGFSNENEQKLRDLLLASFKDAAEAKKAGKSEADQYQIRDNALLAATNYAIDTLKGTHVPTKANAEHDQPVKRQAGMSIGGWICIGLCVLLGIWLVIGLIRAFSGGGGGGGYGGGYGGGGGGGGFFTGLLGGMFGAVAGMWLYNHMFGGPSYYGNDAYAGDSYGGGYGDTGGGADTSGDGDFSGDAGAGGSYDDGAGGDTGGGYDGGGDFGGGGGFDGGGDFGGGGGDFGGGGGDF